ncbi:MAG: hypothetical protein MPK11_02905 [Gammaproteobacteria bacterium]|nr:hypothetical protein [Gammaproteobacteria bacterium]
MKHSTTTPAVFKFFPWLRMFAAAAIFAAAGAAHAQIIEEEDDGAYSAKSKGDFFGTLSGTGSAGTGVQHTYGSVQLGFDMPFARERGRVYFNGLASSSDLTVSRVLTDAAKRNPMPDEDGNPEPETDDLTVRDDTSIVNDAFVQFDLLRNLEVTAGRRRVNWGQFELLSPISLSLPVSLQSADAVTDKIATLFAQDQVALTWFPTPRMEISGYYFNSVQLDPLFESVLSGGSQPEGATDDIYNVDPATVASMRLTQEEVLAPDNDLTDHEHGALRVVFYNNWGTLGFTYHDTNDSLGFESKNARLACAGDIDAAVAGGTTVRGEGRKRELTSVDGRVAGVGANPTPAGTPAGSCVRTTNNVRVLPSDDPKHVQDAKAEIYNVFSNANLFPTENYGIELAIPRGDWVWKFEMLYSDTTVDLQAFSSAILVNAQGEAEGNPDDTLAQARLDYYRAINQRTGFNKAGLPNAGSLSMDATRTITAIGADTDGDKWRLNLTMLYLNETWEDESLRKLQDAAEGADEGAGATFAPAFNVARYLDPDKNREIGVLGGFVGTYFGLAVYRSSLINEKFRWTIGLEAVSNLRDELAAESQSIRYELEDEISFGARLSVIYDF